MARTYKPKLGHSYARKEAIKEPYEVILILCEGEKSEPNYFNGLRREYRLSNTKLVIYSGGSDPLTLVTRAEKELKSGWYDKAFCIFDRNGHATFDKAVQQIANSDNGKSGKLRSITSIPCFEVWVLLHFQYTTRNFTSDSVLKAVQKYFPHYTKAYGKLFEELLPKLETAILYAKNLDKHHHDTDTSSKNPSTKLHECVEYLRKLKT